MASGINECEAVMLASVPRSTASTGVAYSAGYNARCFSMASATRGSSSIPTVLIHVIRDLPRDPTVRFVAASAATDCATFQQHLQICRGISYRPPPPAATVFPSIRTTAGRLSLVPALFLEIALVPGLFDAPSGTLTCSWIPCRSLLSSACNCR